MCGVVEWARGVRVAKLIEGVLGYSGHGRVEGLTWCAAEVLYIISIVHHRLAECVVAKWSGGRIMHREDGRKLVRRVKTSET